ncbi:MAG: DUF72 domain-containing protein [Longimicrobiales bacterium]
MADKLGVILVQLPPDFGPERRSVTARFLRTLPRDLPLAVEFRDRGWLQPEVFELLRETGVALALSTGWWAQRIRKLDKEQVYAYFSNDYQGHSPASARRLQQPPGQRSVQPRELSSQRELFG